MKKVFVLTAAVLIFLFIFTASSSAQYLYNGYSSLLSGALGQADWQLEYLQPLDPGELEKGEYRFSPIIARVSTSGERINYPEGDSTDESDESTMVYGAVFDTALTDKLTIHGKYIYQPWEDYYDSYYGPMSISASSSELDYESRMSLLDLFINYEIKEDNTLYFGYNRMNNKEKDYQNGELDDEEEDTINFYFIGYEMRGKFTGSSD
jgi:hypothetical protein